MNDLKFAFRQLVKNPGFTAVAVLTLALGIGANTTFFSVFFGVVLKSAPYPDSDRLVEIHNQWSDGERNNRLSLRELFDCRERQRSFVGIGASIIGRETLTSNDGADRIQVTRVTANLLPLLGVAPERGRNITKAEEHAGADTSVLVSHEFWMANLGGAKDVLGRAIELNGRRHTIIGVMPSGFSFPWPGVSIWKPLDLDSHGDADRTDHSLQVIARLAPGVSFEQARSNLETIGRQLTADFPGTYPREAGWRIGFESLRASQFGRMMAPLGMLSAAAAAVLLIACLNVAIMFLLRAAMRQREMMIRSALGASRAQLIRQLLTESAVICGLGAVGGFVIAAFGLETFKAFSPEQIPRLQDVRLNGVVTAFTCGTLALVTLIVGLAPALSVMKAGGNQAGGASVRTTNNRATGRLRDALTIVEIAMAVVLLIGAGLTFRSLQGLTHVDLGFATSHLFTFKTNLTPDAYPDADRANQFYDQLSARLENLPGVTGVSAVSYLPLSGEANWTSAGNPSDENAPAIDVMRAIVRGRYFESMRMTLLRGRLFDATDAKGAPPVAIVDEVLARHLWKTTEAAIGKQIRLGDASNPELRTVIGVVHRVKHFGPGAANLPEAYLPQTQVYQRGMYTVVETAGPTDDLAPLIRARLAEVDASVPMYFVGTMEQRRRTELTLPRFTAGLVGAFTVLALVLAGVGIFGVTAYSVGQRSREFGIRFSLGAQRSHVAGLVLKRVARLTLLGVVLGIPASLGAAKLMTSLLFGVAPTDLPTLTITVSGIGLTVLVASVVPMLRALRVNPVEALRAE